MTRRATSAIPPPPRDERRGAIYDSGSPEAIYDSVFCCLIENPATQNPATHPSGAGGRARRRAAARERDRNTCPRPRMAVLSTSCPGTLAR